MKTFSTVLLNACEDYFTTLDHEPTLEDVAEVCTTSISDVVWKALRNAEQNRAHGAVNGIYRTKARKILLSHISALLGQPVGTCIGALKVAFREATTYGFEFAYGTCEGMHESLVHNENDTDLIIGYSLR